MTHEDESRVIQTETGKVVRMSYRKACHGYGIGFASAFFWAATVLAFPILWQHHVPDSLYHTSVICFVVFAVAGFVLVGIAYTNPVWFYELMEGSSNAN